MLVWMIYNNAKLRTNLETYIITYPFPNVNGYTIDVLELRSNFVDTS